MNLLILTQILDKNDDVLGFFHEWVRELSEYFTNVTVISLYRGEFDLPSNVKVLSLGKELGQGKIKYVLTFFKYIFNLRREYDAVFVHMNTEYVLLGGLFWRLIRKPIGLWYAHGTVTWRVRLAEMLSNIVFTSSKLGFRMNSSKLVIVGQGIDTNLFRPDPHKNDNATLRIISVGRISPIKHYEEMIDVAKILRDKRISFSMTIVGKPLIDRDREYLKYLLKKVEDNILSSEVRFFGSVPFGAVASLYKDFDLFFNLSDTGSLDKAVLEAMSAGLIVLTANEAFKRIVPANNFVTHVPEEISESIIRVLESRPESLRDIVVRDHGLPALIKKIAKEYNPNIST